MNLEEIKLNYNIDENVEILEVKKILKEKMIALHPDKTGGEFIDKKSEEGFMR